MLAAAKLLEPLAERVGHLEHVTQAGSITGHSTDNGSPVSQYLKFTNFCNHLIHLISRTSVRVAFAGGIGLKALSWEAQPA